MEAKTSEREDGKDAKEDSIVAKVGRYFFEDSSFSQTFEAWVSKHAPRIDPSLSDDEYPLEYTTLYEEFKKLYEGLLEDYIEREGSSTEAFYAELRGDGARRGLERGADGPDHARDDGLRRFYVDDEGK